MESNNTSVNKYFICHQHFISFQRLCNPLYKHYLMLINLKNDGLQYEGGGGNHVQRLLCLS